MLALEMQPGRIVEDKGFQDFLNVTDPKYVPPSRRTIMREHLPKSREHILQVICITSDCGFGYDVSDMISRLFNKIITETSYQKLTIKPLKLHYKCNL